MKTIDWLKKYQYWIIAVIGTLIIGFAIYQEIRLVKLQNKYAALGVQYYIIQKDRDDYKLRADLLEKKYDSLKLQKDSAIAELDKKKAQLFWLQKKHKREIDSLLNTSVPVDTIYKRTNLLYENWDGGVLEYPFSESQLWQIYAYGVEYPKIKEEYGLQTGVLNSCFDLNNKYKLAENNLKSQILNLDSDIKAANSQLVIQYGQISTLNKQAKVKNIWSTVFKGTTILALFFAVIK